MHEAIPILQVKTLPASKRWHALEPVSITTKQFVIYSEVGYVRSGTELHRAYEDKGLWLRISRAALTRYLQLQQIKASHTSSTLGAYVSETKAIRYTKYDSRPGGWTAFGGVPRPPITWLPKLQLSDLEAGRRNAHGQGKFLLETLPNPISNRFAGRYHNTNLHT